MHCSSGPKVPSWSAFCSPPFRVFLVSLLYNVQGFQLYFVGGIVGKYTYYKLQFNNGWV